MSRIPIHIHESAGVARTGELIVLGVPLPQGLAQSAACWVVQRPDGAESPCQTKPLATWPDGSVKWLEVAVTATVGANETLTHYLLADVQPANAPTCRLRIAECSGSHVVQTGVSTLELPTQGTCLLRQSRPEGQELLGAGGLSIQLRDRQGKPRNLVIERIQMDSVGPVCGRFAWQGHIPRTGLVAHGHWTFAAGSPVVQFEMTLHNPSRARHPRGLWDLGDPGSVVFHSLEVVAPLSGARSDQIRWQEEISEPWRQQSGGTVEILQESSGGENYAHCNHVNRLGKVPAWERGYRVRSAAADRRGLRAEPSLTVTTASGWLAAAVPEFWQQFPKSLAADANQLTVGLLPRQANELHELQGGEQKTFRVSLALGCDGEPPPSILVAAHRPLEASLDAAWAGSTGAIWRLPKFPVALRSECQVLATAAVTGSHSFFAKRETADEFGWRNFGDLWADHEEAYYSGPRPIASHYNNQYDALEGFLLFYLLTGDRHWWQLADPLARHVIDIDIYHTTRDRAAYNGGLFWHTSHYCDAATSTHRAYSRTNHAQGGGGPANEHNYTSGLLLYYFLTGDRQARDAVASLAQWVVNMDDARGHVLGLVQDSPTGFASKTVDASFHGSGRGAGNSINALLDGWQATGHRKFLVKAEELVRRTIHPQDDIAALGLGDAERRWSYTVFLQSLIRWLAQRDECPVSPDLLDYLRDSLLHYARWMTDHETFYLDQPEQLEFPTETWAAQEIRKANVLAASAQLAEAGEQPRLAARAAEFYQRAWSKLMSFPSRHYTRPVVLAIQLGLMQAWLGQSPTALKLHSRVPHEVDISPRTVFVPQKEAVRRALRSPGQLLAMLARLGRVWRWPRVWHGTWAAERVRSLIGGARG